MKLYWKKRPDTGVVSAVEEQTEQATALAHITGQTLLVDPRTNPAVRPYADSLRDQQHRSVLTADDRRVHRKIRVEDRRAEHAEKSLEALQQAREASSPAKSVRALYAGRRRYMHVSLATSIVLAFGSARGLEHLAHEHNIPAGSGYIAEVGLTGLTTIVILARSELTQHGGRLTRLQDGVLWALMVAPLVASMVANVVGANLIGAVCAAGAAAFALFSYVVADAFAVSARAQADRVTGEDETALRRVASGEDLFSASPVSIPSGHRVGTAEAVATAHVATAHCGPTDSGHADEPTPVATAGSTPELTSEPMAVATLVTTAGPTPLGIQKPTSVVTPEPTPEPTGDHSDSGHHREPTEGRVPTPSPGSGHNAEPTSEPTPATDGGQPAPAATDGRAKRRTRAQIRAELEKALKEHYDNGGGEPQVKPLAEAINANRRIVRELLDEMNVRPMIRKAV